MNVKFVKYTGKYPCLCSGVLTLSIDGVEHTFGPISQGAEFGKCWVSGGGVRFRDDGERIRQGPWNSYLYEEECAKLDKHFGQGFSKKLIEIMNDNVPHGCCGGCI